MVATIGSGGAVPPATTIPPELLVADKVTRGGVALHIRPATRSDEAMLIGFFSAVAAEDLRSRFGTTAAAIGSAELAPLLAGDGGHCRTFVAFSRDAAGQALPVAVATLADLAHAASAEVALSVRAGWKRRGIAWTLLDHVLAYAAAHGLAEVTAFERGEDRAAVNLAREMGFVARLVSASPVELSLSKRL